MAITLDEKLVSAVALRSWQRRRLGANTARLDKLQKCMLLILGELTERQREVFLLRYRDGLTVSQAARELGVQKSTVSRTLARAERKIRSAMKYVE